MGLDTMILVFWMLSFKPGFSFSSFTFIKRLSSSSLLSAIRVVSSAYLRLLIFLLAILIPAYDSSSPAFLMMYSAYKLNKQGDYIQPWRTSFPVLNQSIVPCPVLTIASWPAYRFLRRQVKWSGIPISKNFPQFVVIHTVKGISIISKAEVDVFFFWNSLGFSMTQQMLAILSLAPLPFLNPACTSVSCLVTYFGSLTRRILSITLFSIWNEHYCPVAWTFFSSALLWDWNENWPFSVLWPLLNFPSMLAYWVHHLFGFEIAQLEFHHLQ